MSMDQIPAKELMRRLADMDRALNDIAKSLQLIGKVLNRQVPVKIAKDDSTVLDVLTEQEDEEHE